GTWGTVPIRANEICSRSLPWASRIIMEEDRTNPNYRSYLASSHRFCRLALCSPLAERPDFQCPWLGQPLVPQGSRLAAAFRDLADWCRDANYRRCLAKLSKEALR